MAARLCWTSGWAWSLQTPQSCQTARCRWGSWCRPLSPLSEDRSYRLMELSSCQPGCAPGPLLSPTGDSEIHQTARCLWAVGEPARSRCSSTVCIGILFVSLWLTQLRQACSESSPLLGKVARMRIVFGPSIARVIASAFRDHVQTTLQDTAG